MTSQEPIGLITGQRMTREEFLRRWEELPELKNAELIDGTVFVASPVSADHSSADNGIIWWLRSYAGRTRICRSGNNATWYMLESAPQPDAFLYLLPELGGQARIGEKYYHGAPELAVEVCVSSTEIDFGPKLALYQRAGVKEYIRLELFWKRVRWRVLRDGSYVELTADAGSVLRSETFPGLWLNSRAFWAQDDEAVLKTLEEGIAATQ